MTLFSNQPSDDGLPGQARFLAMLAVMLTTTMNVFDGAMVNIALPQMANALHVSVSDTVWVVNSYLLSVAMSLAVFSALAVRIGFRKQFLFGLIVFTLASAGCALSTSLPMLVVMRFIQGIGGSATLSIAPALLRRIFPSRLLGQILGINALLIASCTAIAPLISGSILVTLSWSWLFVINLPLGVVAIVLSKQFLPKSSLLNMGSFDKTGAVLSAIMLGAVILCANAFSGKNGIDTSEALVYIVLALASGVGFVYRQRRATAPLMPLSIFANIRFSLSASTSLVSFIAQGMTFIALPFLFESIYGYSPFISALLFLPWPIGIILIAPFAGKLSDRKNPAVISSLGLLIFAIGLALLSTLGEQVNLVSIVWRSFICGIGFGMFQSPNNREMMANVIHEHSSYASGVLAIMRTFGQCLGTAFIGIILSNISSFDDVAARFAVVRVGLLLATIAVIVAMLVSASRIEFKWFKRVSTKQV